MGIQILLAALDCQADSPYRDSTVLSAFVGLLPHDLLDTNRAENLHRALAELCGAGMDHRAAIVFDSEGANAVVAKKQRRGHADEAAANDEDWNFYVRHRRLAVPRVELANHFRERLANP